MSLRSRKQTAKRPGGHPRIEGPTDVLGNSPSSLPPKGVKQALVSSPPTIPHARVEPPDTRVRCPNPNCGCLTRLRKCSICDTKVPQPAWRLPEDSDIREIAMKIIAFRLGGMSDADIAGYLEISAKSVRTYVYRAHMNGWLNYNSSKEAIEFGLMPKVIRNLDAALDDDYRNENTGLRVKTQVALKIAEGVTFKEFGPDLTPQQPLSQTAISIKIEHPTNPVTLREGTIGGYLEGETHGENTSS